MFENEKPPEYFKLYPFRFVKPYQYQYKTFAKARWLGRQLFEVLIKQFKAYDAEYYKQAIKSGRILINHHQVNEEYIIRNGDEIVHSTVRNQPPILNLPIEIIHEDDEFVVVNKPPSMIVHTGGGHHFNTLMAIMHYEMGYTNLHVLHRLDKCTSGVLFFAKDKEKVAKFHEESQNETMKKMYFARVAGKFSWEQKMLNASIQCISHKDGVYKVFKEVLEQDNQKQKEIHQNNEVKVDLQNKQVKDKQKPKKNKQEDAQGIKDSKTLFKLVWFDQKSDSSLLQCYPITGRTHQIRVHLQYLGFPILNDIVYDGRFVGNKIIETISNPPPQQDQEGEILDKPKKKVKLNQEYAIDKEWDFDNKPWQICLHSYKYTFEGKQYKSSMPYWCQPEAISKLQKQ